MKHSGKAMLAGLKLIFWALLVVAAICALGIIAEYVSRFIDTVKYFLLAGWVVFAAFCFYFFRDPDPQVPTEPWLILSPGHGKVDYIGESDQEFMGGRCRRISMFLSPLDVHVQNAPVAGKVLKVEHIPGRFVQAMKVDSPDYNENVLIGLESAERPGTRLGVRLVAGVLARRIVPWVRAGDAVERGERISLIQFGSRCDVYLPLATTIEVKLGDRVKGGNTVLARYSST